VPLETASGRLIRRKNFSITAYKKGKATGGGEVEGAPCKHLKPSSGEERLDGQESKLVATQENESERGKLENERNCPALGATSEGLEQRGLGGATGAKGGKSRGNRGAKRHVSPPAGRECRQISDRARRMRKTRGS